MKKLLVILLSLTIALGASAQRGHIGVVPRFYYSPQISIIGGYSPFYNPFYSPFYNPYYSPYNSFRPRPTKLDLKVEDIKYDYNEKIWAAKHDTTLKRKERRQEVRRLKHEREQAITEAKLNYYKH